MNICIVKINPDRFPSFPFEEQLSIWISLRIIYFLSTFWLLITRYFFSKNKKIQTDANSRHKKSYSRPWVVKGWVNVKNCVERNTWIICRNIPVLSGLNWKDIHTLDKKLDSFNKYQLILYWTTLCMNYSWIVVAFNDKSSVQSLLEQVVLR